MANGASRVAIVASLGLLVCFIVQAVALPYAASPMEVTGFLYEGGPRPWAVAFVHVVPGQGLSLSQGLTATGAKVVLVDAANAPLAIKGQSVPTYGHGDLSDLEESLPGNASAWLALVWTTDRPLSAAQQQQLTTTAQGIASGQCCLHGFVGTEWGGWVAILAGWGAILLAVVAILASWVLWRGQPETTRTRSQTDAGDLAELVGRTRGYVVALRQIVGWLLFGIALAAPLLMAVWLAAAARTLPHNTDFIVLGLASALGSLVFPVTLLVHRHRRLRREERRLEILAERAPV